jgi:glycosyltransferase involved in cell wall biosynthesis
MTPLDRDHLAKLKVLVVSHGYGYGDELLYFGEIFRELRNLVPQMAVAVDRAKTYRNPYKIVLEPLMQLYRRPIKRKAPDGQIYETEISVPAPTLLARLIARKTDVFITIEFTLPALITTLAATLSRRPLVLLVESDPAARGASTNRWVRKVKRWAVRRAAVIQTNNPQGLRYLVEDLGADQSRVRVAPYLTSRPPGPGAAIEPSTGPLRILFLNSLTERKGLRQFLGALAALSAAERAAIDLTIVGEGPERTDLESQAAELALGALRFVGRQTYDAVGQYYRAAEVLAIPSLADYRSLAGFEGLGYGLALLASCRDGATAETLVDGKNGLVIDPFDPEMMTEQVRRFLDDRSSVLAMRVASLELYREKYALEIVAENIAQSCLVAWRGDGGGVTDQIKGE